MHPPDADTRFRTTRRRAISARAERAFGGRIGATNSSGARENASDTVAPSAIRHLQFSTVAPDRIFTVFARENSEAVANPRLGHVAVDEGAKGKPLGLDEPEPDSGDAGFELRGFALGSLELGFFAHGVSFGFWVMGCCSRS